MPAPEATHAVRCAIDEALRCKKEGKKRDHPVQHVRPRPFRHGGLHQLLRGQARRSGLRREANSPWRSPACRASRRDRHRSVFEHGDRSARTDAMPLLDDGEHHDRALQRRRPHSDVLGHPPARGHQAQHRASQEPDQGGVLAVQPRHPGAAAGDPRRRADGLQRRGARRRSRRLRPHLLHRHSRARDRRDRQARARVERLHHGAGQGAP